MPRYLFLLLMLFALSCKNKTTSLTANQPVKTSDFFDAFKKLRLPNIIADTNLVKSADTTLISYNVFKQFIPDSALQSLAAKKPEGLKIHPVGKIENENEIYLLTTITDGKKTLLIAYLFDKNKHYLNHLLLVSNQSRDGYVHSVSINTEPTFLIIREKTENNQYSYTKHGYAYSIENKGFVEVINDSNEDEKSNVIINPIDTFSNKNKYSGDYVQDKKNFISVRDGSSANSYIFFLHVDKDDGECKGELKGKLTMVNETKAVFQQNGDPCVIDFTFKSNTVMVKERGSCGNYRGMTCMFDDNYKKKKGPPPAKGSKKN
ncbi:hypothetical protein FC093_06995 [Ilyomonas limi]|uniref:Lipoprotein n=1 Tax=Ilyomonas limi TaxID=2575867 RepID=A0A4U3L3Z4_9BACT|nr:hypothetical protein [Ilyomonas limi]TKK69818.1 hypothetical protein FC093_06995 [Ilyomonas limi]